MVAMGIDRPRRKDYVRFLGGKEVGELLVGRIGHFTGAIDLRSEQGPRLKDRTGLFRLAVRMRAVSA